MAKTGKISFTLVSQDSLDENGKSKITIEGTIITSGESYRGNATPCDLIIKYGDTILYDDSFDKGAPANSTTTLFTKTYTVSHNKDGTANKITASYVYDDGWCEAENSYTPPKFPRLCIYYDRNGGTCSSDTYGYNTDNNMTTLSDDVMVRTYIDYKAVSYNLYNVGTFGLSKTGYHIVGSKAWKFKDKSDTYRTVSQDSGQTSALSYYRALIDEGETSRQHFVNWLPDEYAVIYNANGGTEAPESQTKYYGTILKLHSDIPKRVGYNFLGWGTSKTATTVSYKAGDNYESNAKANLYAIWQPKTYTITFDGNGGTTIIDSLEVAYETTQNNDISQYIPQRQAYEFLGWYSSPTGGVQIYDANGLCTNEGSYWLNDVCVCTENYTLYAQWKVLNIAYYKHEGEWKLCRTYIKVNNMWKPAIMYVKSNNKYIR